jgi:DNA-binding response OmpR family regulator
MTTILVADDDIDILELVRFKLSRAGHRLLTASDGEAALALARAEAPDVVVLDWMMPKLNGLEVCDAMRRDPALGATTIILLTARAQEADVERGFAAGADDYITKPFSPRELLSRVEAHAARPAAALNR